MKTAFSLLHAKRSFFGLFMFLLILSSWDGFAQKSNEISLSVYPGFTLVNFEKALGYSDDYMEDWREFHISAAARGFLGTGKSLQAGAEIAWQQLYYAYYVVPYGPSPAYREFNISTFSLTALARFSKNNFFSVMGAGIHFFNNGIAPAVCIEGGYRVNAGENLKI